MKKWTEVVAALIWRGDRFLACQRPVTKTRALLWEFVGGKVEPGESKEDALIRECTEELGITVKPGSVFMEVTHEYEDIIAHLTLFNAEITEGEPQLLEHNDLRWITAEEIPTLPFCPADTEILERIMREMSEKKRIVAYVTGGGFPKEVEVSCLTHVNYAFGWVTEGSLEIREPEQLCYLADLRKEHPFKLLVSLQQRGGQYFCARSKTAEGRALLAKQCRELVDEYGLDGIDVDWEYPGIVVATGEQTCETCREDFIALLQAIRDAIGTDKLLTIACAATPDTWTHTDFVRAGKILDFINVMGYDYNWSVLGAGHQSNLYPSSAGEGDPAQCGDRAIRFLLSQGIPVENLTLGVPFYGYRRGKGGNGFWRYGEITAHIGTEGYTLEFDEAAQQSYLAKDGVFEVAFDDPRTLKAKAEYVKREGLGGMMYWAYALDDEEGTLRHAVYEAMK